MTDIRTATKKDRQVLLEMATAMHAESPQYRGIPLAEDKLLRLIDNLIANPQIARVLVAQVGDEIIGTYWGYLDEYFFSYERLGKDVLLYIKPGRRGGLTAKRLVRAFELWAVEQGARDIRPGVSTGIDNPGYARFYELMDYTIAGYSLTKAASDV